MPSPYKRKKKRNLSCWGGLIILNTFLSIISIILIFILFVKYNDSVVFPSSSKSMIDNNRKNDFINSSEHNNQYKTFELILGKKINEFIEYPKGENEKILDLDIKNLKEFNLCCFDKNINRPKCINENGKSTSIELECLVKHNNKIEIYIQNSIYLNQKCTFKWK